MNDNMESNSKIDMYLDELSSEYKKLLFKALLDSSVSPEDLSISKLLRIDNEIKRPLYSNYPKWKKGKQLSTISGFTYVLIGLFSIVISLNYANYLVIAFGVLLSILGIILLSLSLFILPVEKKGKGHGQSTDVKNSKKLADYEVIAKWRMIEGIANEISVGKKLPTASSVLQTLETNNFITKEELASLRALLKMRNGIIHGSTKSNFGPEREALMAATNKIIEKLRKVL